MLALCSIAFTSPAVAAALQHAAASCACCRAACMSGSIAELLGSWMSHRCASATAASASATLARTPAAWRSNALAAGAFTPAVREPTLPSPWALLLLLLPLGVSVGCPPAATEASDAARARAAAAVAFRDWASLSASARTALRAASCSCWVHSGGKPAATRRCCQSQRLASSNCALAMMACLRGSCCRCSCRARYRRLWS
mmetsp:Transcript_2317/g.5931  ORF Transcript_2317/g.5931 Transcript_2317/m.5931 type:complete len:200 (-) Transcript_2317:548-1147(-)